MLTHKLKPGESLYIRGEIEIKNLGSGPAKIGCIGDGEVSIDAVSAIEPTEQAEAERLAESQKAVA
jgi:hypothetical protein